jgi:hypothetical protein
MESSGNAQQEGGKVVLLLRVVPSLKSRLAVYARSRGLTLNGAATVLLDEALDETGEHPRSGTAGLAQVRCGRRVLD